MFVILVFRCFQLHIFSCLLAGDVGLSGVCDHGGLSYGENFKGCCSYHCWSSFLHCNASFPKKCSLVKSLNNSLLNSSSEFYMTAEYRVWVSHTIVSMCYAF